MSLTNTRPDPGATFKVLIHNQRGDSRTQEQEFVINRDLFCQRSEFLREELKEAIDGASDPDSLKPVVIEHHDPADFANYLRYINTGSFDMPTDDQGVRSFMLRLYVLTNHLRDLSTANFAITYFMRLSDRLGQLPPEREILYVWETVRDFTNPLRRLFVDYQIHEAPGSTLVFDTDGIVPFEYPVDVTLGFSDLATQEGNRGRVGRDDDIFKVKCLSRDKCYYHQHEGEHSQCLMTLI